MCLTVWGRLIPPLEVSVRKERAETGRTGTSVPQEAKTWEEGILLRTPRDDAMHNLQRQRRRSKNHTNAGPSGTGNPGSLSALALRHLSVEGQWRFLPS